MASTEHALEPFISIQRFREFLCFLAYINTLTLGLINAGRLYLALGYPNYTDLCISMRLRWGIEQYAPAESR